MDRLRNVVVHLREQLWIIPLCLSAMALSLTYWILTSGASFLEVRDVGGFWSLYCGDAISARDLMSSLQSGLMTMTSLVVSVTFVILTLAANQLGPRLISTFMGDRQIQTVLWLFLGTEVRVIAQRSDMQGLTDAAFDVIRQAGQNIPSILIRMADVLGQLAPVLHVEEARVAVTQHLGKLAEITTEAGLALSDRTAVLRRIEQARVATAIRPKEGNIHIV
jgi:uncharacterized membrane protein